MRSDDRSVDAALELIEEGYSILATEATKPGLIHGWITALANHFETGSRHNGAVSITVGALKESACGYLNAQTVLDTLRPMFIAAATRPPTGGEHQRTEREACDEYRSIVAWAVGQALGADLDEVRARSEEKMFDNHAWMWRIPATGIGIESKPAPLPISLGKAHKTFRRWLGEDYDTDALDAVLAAAAVERFEDGSDPVWLLLISGPGNAKTETVQALDGIDATIVSTIASEGALLSATPKRERAKGATGGLPRTIGERGELVIKDVTSILSPVRPDLSVG